MCHSIWGCHSLEEMIENCSPGGSELVNLSLDIKRYLIKKPFNKPPYAYLVCPRCEPEVKKAIREFNLEYFTPTISEVKEIKDVLKAGLTRKKEYKGRRAVVLTMKHNLNGCLEKTILLYKDRENTSNDINSLKGYISTKEGTFIREAHGIVLPLTSIIFSDTLRKTTILGFLTGQNDSTLFQESFSESFLQEKQPEQMSKLDILI